MSDVRVCPHCGTDQRGRALTDEECASGWWGKDTTHFWRTIGVEVRGVYDGVLFYRCPDCGGSWHRWSAKDHPRMYEKAAKYVGPPLGQRRDHGADDV